MRQTLLPEVIPYSESLDNGVISVPAHKMSGDYYHYIKDENGCVGVAMSTSCSLYVYD
jgi:phosphoserine phosphatase RsbU/P